jgi:hypothetical protein
MYKAGQIEVGHSYFFVVDSKYAVAGRVTAVPKGNIVIENGIEFSLREAWRDYHAAPKKLFDRKEIPMESIKPLLKY